MKALYKRYLRPILFRLEPEKAHRLAALALKSGVVRPSRPAVHPGMASSIAGLSFPNPIGMAAGFDKNAEFPDALFRLGFGFVEIGTLTPRPQSGNPRPRMFRLEHEEALINRLGFNNCGHAAAVKRLSERPHPSGVLGINIGANRDSEDRVADYVAGISAFYAHADYFSVNVSSPNTPGLRGLQGKDALKDLLAQIMKRRSDLTGRSKPPPVFLKIAPDVDEEGMDAIAEEVLYASIDGVIVSNTTLARPDDLTSSSRTETGGLSGKPLRDASTVILAKMRQRLGPTIPLIGVGGVASAADVVDKVKAGADLVQLYTALIYQGPGLPARILGDLDRFMKKEGIETLSGLKNSNTEKIAST